MSLDKIFGLYTLGFLGVTVLIGIGEMAFGLFSNQMDRLDLHGAVAADLRVHRHRDPDVESRPVLRGRPRGARALQRHGHRLGLDVGRLVHLDGRRALGAGLRRPRLRHGLDGRLPPPRRLPRPLPPAVRRVHDSRLPRARATAATRRGMVGVVGAVACSLHLPHRPGDGRRPDRRALHRHRLQRRRLRRPHRRALLLGAGRDEVGDLDPGRPVHHPDHVLPGAGGVPVVDSCSRSRSPS